MCLQSFKMFAQFSIKRQTHKYKTHMHAYVDAIGWLTGCVEIFLKIELERKTHGYALRIVALFHSPSTIYYYHSECVYNFDFIKKLECESVCVYIVQCSIFYIRLYGAHFFLLIFHVTFSYIYFLNLDSFLFGIEHERWWWVWREVGKKLKSINIYQMAFYFWPKWKLKAHIINGIKKV